MTEGPSDIHSRPAQIWAGRIFLPSPTPNGDSKQRGRAETRPNFPGLALRIFKRVARKEKATLQEESQRRFFSS